MDVPRRRLILVVLNLLFVEMDAAGLKLRKENRGYISFVKEKKKDDNAEDIHVDHVTRKPWSIKSPVPREFYTAPKNCNLHNYSYIINHVALCLQHSDVFMLVLVRTVFSQFDRRMAIRETWGASKSFADANVLVVFLFGLSSDQRIQKSISRENELYGDIIQENFVDSYENLTLKTVMAWKWARTYCPHATYVMVMNDEVFIDTFKLMPYLMQQMVKPRYQNHFVVCYYFPCCTRAYPDRTKYAVNRIYSSRAFPAYCSGTAYIASLRIINQLYLMSLDTPSFMPDDAWMGVLAEKLDLKFVDTEAHFAGISNRPTLLKNFMRWDYLEVSVMIGIVDYDFPGQEAVMIRHLWRLVLDHHGSAIRMKPEKLGWQILDEGNVVYLAVSMMMVDVFVVCLIFFLLFCKNKFKLSCRASYRCLF